MKRLDTVVCIVLALLYGFGVTFHRVPATAAMVQGLTPWVLLLTAALTCVSLAREHAGFAFVWVAGAFLAGYVLEVVGVATGAIFGAYGYGDVLGVKLLGVPLVIGINWAFVILGATTLCARFLRIPALAALASGVLTTGFDWVMEPVAVRMGYWHWDGGAIPARNYVAWFVISGALSFVLVSRKRAIRSWVPMVAFILQLGFFLALRVTL
jgi:bisanhydrobacterioruberin hydratase